ncbi:hypothetical protein NDU88_005791 [Pleurodeles waltl]|uniref:Uncharacterized protein n=1 Tax=Pleurodeles waltl TaxID=8319 RepID=A0AAV7W907_PLEWA|nr:hypothetical protein NDU88_005791 [Pleurodeles waltl]
MDSAMAPLTAETKSMRLEITGFQTQVTDDLKVRLTAEFSRETNNCRRAFLALGPRLRQLDVKYGLFEPAIMWITKNGESQDFYDPANMQVFLEGLQDHTQPIDMETSIRIQDTQSLLPSVAPLAPVLEAGGRATVDSHTRGRDLERLMKSHNNRGQVLQAVAMHTQITGRDKSRSPLKITLTTT